MSELPGFVSAEVPFKYENPNLPSTLELQNTLKKNFKDLGKREAFEVYINEHNGDRINQIKLDNNLDKAGQRMVSGDEFRKNRIILDKYKYNLEDKTIADPLIYIDNKGKTHNNVENTLHIIDKKYFNSTAHPM